MYYILHHREAVVSVECESWDIECLRTPRGAGAKGVNGERGGAGDFMVSEGIMLSSCWNSPVSSITWLLVCLALFSRLELQFLQHGLQQGLTVFGISPKFKIGPSLTVQLPQLATAISTGMGGDTEQSSVPHTLKQTNEKDQ
ncbi:hypothetical protein F7725_010233 [Dissostichus mawsoni]|uniref:Uncharacterized protein n=1 Tax=Dissostichus mawsoni TaxID=36200 RepID=A0A7J5XMX7_DISMA|nr:hypothetical protein F7725_010233 [Dissostichus mawsoni]